MFLLPSIECLYNRNTVQYRLWVFLGTVVLNLVISQKMSVARFT